MLCNCACMCVCVCVCVCVFKEPDKRQPCDVSPCSHVMSSWDHVTSPQLMFVYLQIEQDGRGQRNRSKAKSFYKKMWAIIRGRGILEDTGANGNKDSQL